MVSWDFWPGNPKKLGSLQVYASTISLHLKRALQEGRHRGLLAYLSEWRSFMLGKKIRLESKCVSDMLVDSDLLDIFSRLADWSHYKKQSVAKTPSSLSQNLNRLDKRDWTRGTVEHVEPRKNGLHPDWKALENQKIHWKWGVSNGMMLFPVISRHGWLGYHHDSGNLNMLPLKYG